jgi:hypothetical protein
VGGKGEENLVVAAFSVKELAPWQHVGALQKSDF